MPIIYKNYSVVKNFDSPVILALLLICVIVLVFSMIYTAICIHRENKASKDESADNGTAKDAKSDK